jgi:hypothetical protein
MDRMNADHEFNTGAAGRKTSHAQENGGSGRRSDPRIAGFHSARAVGQVYELGETAKPVGTIVPEKTGATAWLAGQAENEKPQHTIESGQAISEMEK